jgi:hypothetical protein
MNANQTLTALLANRPQSIDDVDEWLARYIAAGETARDEAAARERLNDAAPELLDCLQRCLDEMAWIGPKARKTAEDARAAIAKATGSAQ